MKASKIIITGAAALALVAAGTAAGAVIRYSPRGGSGVIHGCYGKPAKDGSHSFVLQDTQTACPPGWSAISWNQQGPAGGSGVVSMQQYQPNNAASVVGDHWGFLGSPPEEDFANANTAAQVTATVMEGEGPELNGASGLLGICYGHAHGTGVTEVSQINVGMDGEVFSISPTISGVVGGLTPGEYHVGLCAKDQGPGKYSSGIVNGEASVTIILAETATGVNHGTRQGTTPTRLRHAE